MAEVTATGLEREGESRQRTASSEQVQSPAQDDQSSPNDPYAPIAEEARSLETHPGEGDVTGTLLPATSPPTPLKEGPITSYVEGEEGENAEPSGFQREGRSGKMLSHASETAEEGQSDVYLHRMHKFSLYETMTRFYLIGSDVLDEHYRVLKIDRTAAPGHLSIIEDETIYSKNEMNQLLNTIEDGNRAVGGMRYRGTSWGLLGFIRFTEAYYMLLIKKKVQVATIGGHYIFQIDDTDLVPLTTGPTSNFRNNRNAEEARFLSILGNLDLNRHFYFSYSYNVTRTLQHNIIRRREAFAENNPTVPEPDFNDMFVWNHHLLKPAMEVLKNPFDWCMPIIHGFVDQAAIDVFGRNVYLTIIARRSRFFAGARFLKRGANDLGYVANDVETEQIAADMLVTSFNAPRLRQLKNPNYTSYVQHRGSIPLYWTQDSSGVSPKPAIDLNLIDPFYSTAALHFDNLFSRYRAPVYVLNLVKARERIPRESKLLVEYQNAINYLNQSLPADKKILYRAYDMSRAAKTRGQDVIGTLESIAESIVKSTGFFRNDGNPHENGSAYVQNGVARSNCIDCLDRTNAAQFVIGKRALALQLQALGVIPTDASLNYDSDASNLFAHMFNDQGDTLASQYGGSHLVNTTDSYRKINNWQSHSRDMLESFKRYYHNSFLDSQRQEAYNLFLGNYTYTQGQPMLWELPTDYYLHHTNPRKKLERRDYINWYTPDYLEPASLPPVPDLPPERVQNLRKDWWDEYYRPSVLTSYHRLFAWGMNNTNRYLPKTSQKPGRYDLSPFCVRKTGSELEQASSREALRTGEGNKVLRTESKALPTPLSATSPPHTGSERISSLQKWLYPDPEDDDPNHSSIHIKSSGQQTNGDALRSAQSHARRKSLRTSTMDDGEEARIIAGMQEFKPSNKQLQSQWTLAQFHANSLNPSVANDEAYEYERYLGHAEKVGATHSDGLINLQSGSNEEMGVQHGGIDDAEVQALEDYVASGLQGKPSSTYLSGAKLDEELQLGENFATWLRVPHGLSLSVTPEDAARKRYQAYGKWLRGKSFFRQSKIDPEAKLAEQTDALDNGDVALMPQPVL